MSLFCFPSLVRREQSNETFGQGGHLRVDISGFEAIALVSMASTPTSHRDLWSPDLILPMTGNEVHLKVTGLMMVLDDGQL